MGTGERDGSRRIMRRQPPPELLSPPPHSWSASQKANCRGTIAPSIRTMFYLISTERRGGSLAGSLLVLGCHAKAGPNILGDNSRFGQFNSRLGGREFPVRSATGIRSQEFDLPHHFFGQTAIIRGKSTKFPVSTRKTGNFALIGGTGRGSALPAAPPARQQSRLSASLSAD
jgi:hypothetical protein